MKGAIKNAPLRNRNRARFNLRGRVMLVVSALALCSVSLVGRAAYVQLVNSDFYQRQGNERFIRDLEIPTSRGMITDRNGEPVAVSSPVESIWCDPKALMKDPAQLPLLASALGEPEDALTRRISQRADREFYYLKRRINPDEARKILAHKIPGVYSKREFRRFYPQGEAMSHVLGFTNVDDRGQEGLELAFDAWLRGTAGAKRVIRDNQGRIIENVDLVRQAEPGKPLTLSIDRRIQYLAYRELKLALEKTGAASGSAVVLDVATGEVLAMANLPTYNPNAPSTGKLDTMRNRAVIDLIEPGSTIKPLTVAAALEARLVTPDTIIDTSPGWMANGRFRTNDVRNYGPLSVTGVITKSSNVGVSKIVAGISNQEFYNFLHRFGYGQKPGSGFPGEASGTLPEPQNWWGTSKQTMSYGYGLSATPLQVAQAYAALANGGVLVPPTFVKGQRNEGRQVLDPLVADQIMEMMQTVTEPGGTARQAAILGYHVAGKTGTARISRAGGYDRRYTAFFAGVVPVDNPRFSMAVVITDPDPARGYYGGAVSGPVFHNVMEGALRLMDVPPDDIETWLAAQAKGEAKLRAATPALPTALVEPAAGAIARSSALPAALPAALPEPLQ